MNALARFQDDFARALFGQDSASPLQAQPAFAVYRNTVMKGCVDALDANYPAVVRLVGRDWFRSAAALYVQAEAPADSALLHYGDAFAGFLRGFEPAAELPYLSDVARLDRFWGEAHAALDAPVLDAAQLAGLSSQALMDCRLAPHPAARWAWFSEQPIYTIWARNRSIEDAAQEQGEIEWRGEGALVTRPKDEVCWQAAGAADCAFLDACAQGLRLAEAIEQAQQADSAVDLMALLARLLQAGALAAPTSSTESDT